MNTRLCVSFAVVLAVFLPAVPAVADGYPSKPVRLVVPFGAGGSTDVLLRIVATRLPEVLGQQIVIDNRTGAGGMIGTEIAAEATGDGYTLLGTGSPHAIVPNLYRNVPYDPQRDFAPIMQIASQPYGVVVHPSLPVTSVAELIALARREPGRHNYASSGQGGAMHLFQAQLYSMAGVNVVHVPYKGSGPVRADLVGGQVKIGCLGLSSILPLHRAGQLRIIAVTTAKRSTQLPDVPAVAESVPGYDTSLWTGLLAPRGTPAVAIRRIHRDVTGLLQRPEVQGAFRKLGTDIVATDPQAFAAFLRQQFAQWGKVVRELNLRVN